MDIVKMEHVTKIYGSGDTRVWALDDVNLTVQKGESLAVVGASGSGKSTLLHVMGGVDTVTNGKVIVDDRDITTLKDEEMSVFRRRKIGFVFQSYHLIPVLTVEENIQMPILFALYRVIYNMPAYVTRIRDAFGVIADSVIASGKVSEIQNLKAAAAYARNFAIDERNAVIDVLYVMNNKDLAAYATGHEDVLEQISHFNNCLGINIPLCTVYLL